MKILIFGGNQFIGRHIAMEAVARGHEVTVFNRGSYAQPDGVAFVKGDRFVDNSLSALDGLRFDTVIDTWMLNPDAVRDAVTRLRGRIGQYIYVSTVSVYDYDRSSAPYKETTPLHDELTAPVQYFKDKVGGEREASKADVPVVIARLGVTLGPQESIGRLPWWLRRTHKGGQTLAPEDRGMGLQFIDVRDVATFLIDAAEKKASGAFNLVSKHNLMTMAEFLDLANETTGNKAEFTWVDQDTVIKAGISPFFDWPITVTPEVYPVYLADVTKALEHGLRIRPARETFGDTWSWMMEEEQAGRSIEIIIPWIGEDKENEALRLASASNGADN